MTTLGMIFPPDRPPEQLREVAQAADTAGVDELWLWEDCFAESGIATAGAVLAWTQRLGVGVGLLPVPLRNVALTAMELATLERMFPGRVRPGIGHGVLDWMGQVGERVASPMTLLREYTDGLRRLLHGEQVTVEGRYVQLTDVRLAWPPQPPPPLLVGGIKPRTLALAGELGDGVILTGDTGPDELRTAVPQVHAARAAGSPAPQVVLFLAVPSTAAAADLAAQVRTAGDAGATHVALRAADDDVPLTEFAQRLGREVRPLLG